MTRRSPGGGRRGPQGGPELDQAHTSDVQMPIWG